MKKLHIKLIIAAFIGALAVSAFNIQLIRYGALRFNFFDTITQKNVSGLPTETIIYNFLLLLSGLFLYEFLNVKFPDNKLNKFGLFFSNLLIGLSIAFAYLGKDRNYTLLTFSLVIVLLVYVEYFNKLRFMYRFYRAYCVFLIPLILINFILISKNRMFNNPQARLELNIGIIPLENYFYMMSMLLISVLLFEKLQAFKRK